MDGTMTTPLVPADNALSDPESIDDVVKRLKADLPQRPIVCILGSTVFSIQKDEGIVSGLASSLASFPFTFITGGMPGVQETFAKNIGDPTRLFHLRPLGRGSGFEKGTDLFVGHDEDYKKAVLAAIGDIYITIEGGPGVAKEASAAFQRGALILPLISSGGASKGMFDFPANALTCPVFVTGNARRSFDIIQDEDAPIAKVVEALNVLMRQYYKKVVMNMPYYWVPKWAVCKDVQGFVEEWNNNLPGVAVPLGIVCGRGIFWAGAANALIWPGYIGFVTIAYSSCVCHPGGGIAKYDTRLWLLFMLFFIVQVPMELKALGYVIYNQVQATGPFNFLGKTLSFAQWFVMTICFSFIAHMDVCSNSFFLAAVIYTSTCSKSVGMDKIWKDVIDQSMLHPIDGTFGIYFNIPTISMFVWLLTFLQPIHALLLSVPVCEPGKWWPPMCCWDVDYMPKGRAKGKPDPRNEYATGCSIRQNHGNALMAISEVGRMMTVTFQDETFAMSRFLCALDRLDKSKDDADSKMDMKEEAVKCLQHAVGLLQRSQFKFFMQGFLEMSAMLNWQISLLGMQRCSIGIKMRPPDEMGIAITMKSLNWQIVLSILLSVVLGLKKLADVYSIFTKTAQIFENVQERTMPTARNGQSPSFLRALCGKASQDKEVQSMYSKVRRSLVVNAAYAIVYMMGLGYAMAKLWAVFYCPSSLWNFALYPPNGCVQM
jgi:hypothetical protein